jgi:chromosome segregation ATPase
MRPAMKGRNVLLLCAISLLAGAAVGFFAARGDSDKELDEAIEERARLIAELDDAAKAVKDSSGRLESIRAEMSAATNAAETAAGDISSGTMRIEALARSLRTYVQDAQAKLAKISGELERAIGANKSGVDAIVGILDKARSELR